MTIGERVKAIRVQVGLTQKDFAERIGISAPSVARIESGENNPAERTVRLICHEFNVSEAWLVEGVGEMFRSESPAEAVLRVMAGEDEVAKAIFLALAEAPPEHWEAFRQYALRLKSHLDSLPPDLLPPNQKGDP